MEEQEGARKGSVCGSKGGRRAGGEAGGEEGWRSFTFSSFSWRIFICVVRMASMSEVLRSQSWRRKSGRATSQELKREEHQERGMWSESERRERRKGRRREREEEGK